MAPNDEASQLTVAVGIAALLGEVPLPFEHFGWGNHLLVAAGVFLERGSHTRFTGHGIVPFCVKQESAKDWIYCYSPNPGAARVEQAAPQAPSTEPGGEPRLVRRQPAAVLPATEGHRDRGTDSVQHELGEDT
jgi:hypothetical protein